MQCIDKAKGVTRIAATNLMLTDQGPLFLSDTSINIDPSAKELAKIAQMNHHMCNCLGLSPPSRFYPIPTLVHLATPMLEK